MRLSNRLLTMVFVAVGATSIAHGADLVWRIENPFRLFRDTADFERLKIPKGSSVQDWFANIAPQIHGDFLPYRRTHWDPPGGMNFTGQYPSSYVRPESHRIILTWKTAPAIGTCDWEIGKETKTGASCASMRADIPYDRSAEPVETEVKVSASDGSTAQTSVVIRDRLVLGLGDSYSAGQGSPDRPSELSISDSRAVIADPFKPKQQRTIKNIWFPKLVDGRPADWWDRECNRSLLSWQVMAALKLASDFADEAVDGELLEQNAVTFISYACSGAEFFDGIFTPQVNPPGPIKATTEYQTEQTARTVQHSQLFAAGQDLCERGSTRVTFQARRQVLSYVCDNPRVPDAVLFSIGGNDAGFARVIMHQLIPLPNQGNHPPGRLGLLIAHKLLRTVDLATAKKRIDRMAPNYKTLGDHLQKQLRSSPRSVIVMAYPNPLMRPALYRNTGAYCGLEMRAGMEAARERAAPFAKAWWYFWITQAESQDTFKRMIDPLSKTIAASKPQGWRLVTEHLATMEGEHGMCADMVRAEDDQSHPASENAFEGNVQAYGLPRYEVIDRRRLGPVIGGVAWNAYDSGQKRWIRTPNDSLRTQTTATLTGSTAGAFHPTGAGYAAMADAAYMHLREVIPSTGNK